MTRLLNTPIIGPSAKTVASSWIDMLAGLSGLYILNMPPGFWANAGSPANSRQQPSCQHQRARMLLHCVPPVRSLPLSSRALLRVDASSRWRLRLQKQADNRLGLIGGLSPDHPPSLRMAVVGQNRKQPISNVSFCLAPRSGHSSSSDRAIAFDH